MTQGFFSKPDIDKIPDDVFKKSLRQATQKVLSNKYYTPSIEDIRVGYECEWWRDPSKENDFIPLVMDKKEAAMYLDGRAALLEIRTPYLTEEQIEAEGWKQEGKSPNESLYYFTKIKENEWNKSGWRLKFYKNDKYLAPIDLQFWHDRNGDLGGREGWGDIFSFDCPSINEFRYLTNNLLKIN